MVGLLLHGMLFMNCILYSLLQVIKRTEEEDTEQEDQCHVKPG